jgi:hypothetical protein
MAAVYFLEIVRTLVLGRLGVRGAAADRFRPGIGFLVSHTGTAKQASNPGTPAGS